MSNIFLLLSIVVVVQPLICVWLSVTLWTATRQASCPSLSPRVCSNSCAVELMVRSNHLVLCHLLFFFFLVTFLSMQNLKYKILLSLKSFSCCFSSPLNFQFWKCCPTARIKYYFTVRILPFLGEKNLLISLKIHWKQNGVLNTGNIFMDYF